MSDFCMAYPEMNGGVLRYYIYNIYYNIYYIYNKYYLQYFLFYPFPIEEWLIENLTFLNLTILHIASELAPIICYPTREKFFLDTPKISLMYDPTRRYKVRDASVRRPPQHPNPYTGHNTMNFPYNQTKQKD